jgi:hypothetical protein
MKSKILFLALCVAAYLPSYAQVRLEPFYPYSKISLGLAIGHSHMYGDLQHSISEPVYKLTLDRNFNSYSSVGLEVQRGALGSEEFKNHWTNGLTSYNQYTSASLNGKVAIGQFFEYPKNFLMKTVYSIYVKTGFGVMANDVSNISYKFKNKDKLEIRDIYTNSIKTNNVVTYIPYNLGFNLHLTKRCEFNVNYQFVYTFSDYVDGYNFPNPPANNFYNDMYSTLTFGLNFYIGKMLNHDYDEKGIGDKFRRLTE